MLFYRQLPMAKYNIKIDEDPELSLGKRVAYAILSADSHIRSLIPVEEIKIGLAFLSGKKEDEVTSEYVAGIESDPRQLVRMLYDKGLLCVLRETEFYRISQRNLNSHSQEASVFDPNAEYVRKASGARLY